MSTKVHDNEDEAYDEVDLVLASAKLELHRKRCSERKSRRNFNLSDIPENFAHVPSTCMSEPNSRPASIDTSESLDYSNRVRYRPHQKQLVSFMARMRWLSIRYMGCMRAVDSNCDISGVNVAF